MISSDEVIVVTAIHRIRKLLQAYTLDNDLITFECVYKSYFINVVTTFFNLERLSKKSGLPKGHYVSFVQFERDLVELITKVLTDEEKKRISGVRFDAQHLYMLK
jgi:hypothetical protein